MKISGKNIFLTAAALGATFGCLSQARAAVVHRLAPKQLTLGTEGVVYKGIIYTRKDSRSGQVTTIQRVETYNARNVDGRTVLGDRIAKVTKSEAWQGPNDVKYVLHTQNTGFTERFLSREHLEPGSKTVVQKGKWVFDNSTPYYPNVNIDRSTVTATVVDGKALNVQGVVKSQWNNPLPGKVFSKAATASNVAPQFRPLVKPGAAEQQTWQGW